MRNYRKKSKAKLIICIALASILVAVTICSIVLAVVKKDFSTNLAEPETIRIYSTESSSFYEYNYRNDSEEYKQIVNLINDSYKASLMTLMTTGSTKKEAYVENTKSQSNVTTNIIKKNPDYFYIEYDYANLNVLMINDEPYYKAGTNDTITYKKLLFEIKDATNFNEITIYVENYYSYSSSDTISSSYQIITYANQTYIYNYLAELTSK